MNTHRSLLTCLALFGLILLIAPVGCARAAGEAAYRVVTASSMTAIPLEYAPPADAPATPSAVSLTLARRGSDSFQVVVLPTADLASLSLETSALTAGRNKIEASNIEWFVVGHTPSGKTRVPDMLLPLRSFAAENGKAWSLYVTVHAPVATPTGNYVGAVRVVADGQPPTSIPLNVMVHDFTLPLGPGHCRTAFALQEGFKTWGEGEFRKYADYMLRHRLNPDNIYRLQPPRVADLEHYYDLGLNYFSVSKVAKGWDLTGIKAFFAELEKSPHGKELRQMGMFYGYDEKGKEHRPGMGECFRALHAEFPDIETMTTAHVYMDWPDPVARMKEFDIDVVAPWIHPGYPIYYRFAEGEQVRAAGKQLWAYNINYQTHYPLIQSRLTGWEMYQQKADGWMYYCVNGWKKDATPIDPAKGPLVDFVPSSPNSQAELIYPGIDGPIGSLRLANIRDGFEDYEYLWAMAAKAGDVEVAREIAESAAWGILQWTDKPDTVRAARALLARWLARPYLARTPAPTHRAAAVPATVVLQWQADKPADVRSFDVYIGTDREALGKVTPISPEYRGKATKPMFKPGNLKPATTYYWRVDEMTKSGLNPGYVWSFSTNQVSG